MSKQPISMSATSHHGNGLGNPSFPVARIADEEHPLVTPRHAWYVPVKGLCDFCMALVLFLITLPAVILSAIAIKLTSRGPALYLQQRSGKSGRPFTLFKLRTMVQNAEAETGAVWTQPNDPRITRLGRILRKTHIDEFPQLINVLLGQMSLVGPRPERPEFVHEFEWTVPHYRERLNVRPGITGFAQLELPPDTDVESVRKKLSYDIFYIRNASPWFDARILCFTAGLFFKTFWVAAWKRIRMPNVEQVEACITDVVGSESEIAEPHDCA